MPPLISVVIPTYNRADMLPRAVESALAQTLSDLEIIIVDDGSTDRTPEVIAGYHDPRIVPVLIGHTGVLGVVRNAGIARAQGAWVAFLDSDDVWLPDKLAQQAAVLEQDAEVGVVCTNANVIGTNGEVLSQADSSEPRNGRLFDDLAAGNFVTVSSVLVRRPLLERVGGFAEHPLLHGVEDYDLWLRLALITDFVYLPDRLVLYRKHVGSMNHQPDMAQHWRALVYIMDRLNTELRGRYDEIRRSRRTVRRRRRDLATLQAEADGAWFAPLLRALSFGRLWLIARRSSLRGWRQTRN